MQVLVLNGANLDTLPSGDVEYLRLEGFEPEKQILERLLAASEGSDG